MDTIDPDPTFRGLMATCALAHEHHIAQKLSGSPNPAASARCLQTFRQQICELRDLLNNDEFFSAITADQNGNGAHLSHMAAGAAAFGLAMGIKPSDDDSQSYRHELIELSASPVRTTRRTATREETEIAWASAGSNASGG